MTQRTNTPNPQSISLGTVANDGTGDNLRVGGQKINENFLDLYNAVNAIPDETLRSILTEKVILTNVRENSERGYLFNNENAIQDPNMRNLSENNLILGLLSNKHNRYTIIFSWKWHTVCCCQRNIGTHNWCLATNCCNHVRHNCYSLSKWIN